ncbi:fibroblast growth factor receptor 2-like [Haliotis rufescens]|uniref:fibroblast growth factor receptor 2-like n=1 Tax=Haliotis rufescens TaxID=6454 RepID=UPI00201E95BE|nr:fibroblast growth factor receptor 2-like [Haliotis rufescens]
MGVNTEEISDSSVRVTWHHSPSCYPRTFIWINYEWDTGHSDMIKVYKDANYYDLTDLDPSRAYTVKVTTDYGGIKSKPVAVSFKTLDAPAQPGIGTGAIAGIAIGALLIVVVLGVGIFVWKTGKAAAMMKRRRSRYTTRRTYQEPPRGKLNNAEAKVMSYKNNAYNADDDIYQYGSMEFGLEQPWYISKDNLKLQQELQVGKFARILKATYKHGAQSTEVVAKVLKDEVNDASRLMMLAKINFAATQVGEHRNVLKFIGAVVNNDALGPVMVLEICRKGQLDKWLSSHQNKINDEIMEKVNLFALGVARGMAYLADKGIVHRKLGARNCLLTSSDEVKVTGFGPCKLEEDGEDNNAKSDKIPVKWTAPECFQSLKGANEKSDSWSFGITMWEIFSMGKTPYDGVRSRDLPTKIRNGHRLKKPEFAEDVHYELMQTCWKSSPQARPTFAEMLGKLQALFGLTPSSDETYYYAS